MDSQNHSCHAKAEAAEEDNAHSGGAEKDRQDVRDAHGERQPLSCSARRKALRRY